MAARADSRIRVPAGVRLAALWLVALALAVLIGLFGAAAAPAQVRPAALSAALPGAGAEPAPCAPGGRPAPNEPFCRSALAAERSVRISKGMLTIATAQLVGMVGQIIALVLTLRDSNRASRAATRAAAIASRQAEIAERGTETQLRAYVLVDAGTVRHREGEDTLVRITIKNYGQTPAFGAKAWVHSRLETLPLAVALPEPPEDLPMSNMVMGPGFSSTFTHRHAGAIEGRGLQELEAGRAALYVYGAITYQDALGKTHTSRYLLFSSGKGALAAGMLSAYPTGNEAD